MDRYYGNEWGRKGATISDKTARLEYGLTQDEIYDAIDAGKLQYRGLDYPRTDRSEHGVEGCGELGVPIVD
jgi:hypothetical protein